MCYRQGKEESGDLRDAGGFYHGRPPLPLGEARGLVLVGVHTAELLAIRIVDTHQPMVMFAAAVLGESILIFIRCVFSHFARPSL